MGFPDEAGECSSSSAPHLLEAVEMFTCAQQLAAMDSPMISFRCAQQLAAMDSPMISFRSDSTKLRLSSDTFFHLDQGTINRSELLKGICEAAEVPGDAPVPVSSNCVQRWLSHVLPGIKTCTPREIDNTVHPRTQGVAFDTETGLPGNHRQMNGSTFAGQRFEAGNLTSASTFKFRKVAHELCEVGNTCSLFQAADLLIDEKTKREACCKLAALLREEIEDEAAYGRAHNRPATEAVVCLPDDLAFQALAAVELPLGRLLAHFPSIPARLLALRAHHPSIDADATLCLETSHPAPLHLALPAITTLTHLRTLSLAGHTFPPLPAATTDFGAEGTDAAYWDPAVALVSLLTALPQLTHLSLRDTVLVHAFDELRERASYTLPPPPPLPNLLSLDLGHNNLDTHLYIPNRRRGGGCGGWSVAGLFKSATSLRAVDLDGTLNTARALSHLAGVLLHLPQLERLAVGASRELFTECTACPAERSAALLRPDGCTAVALLRLALAMRWMDALRSLVFNFSMYPVTPRFDVVHTAARAAVGRAVGSLERLEHLSVGHPAFCNCGPSREHEDNDEEDDDEEEAAAAVAGAVADVLAAHGPGLPPEEAGLAALTRLTSLDVRPAMSLCTDGAITLARSLEHALGLRELRLPYVVLTEECCSVLLETVWRLAALTAFEVHHKLTITGAPPDRLASFVQSLEAMPHLREVRGPALLNLSPADDVAGSAAGAVVEWPATGALAAASPALAGPGKAIELDAEVLDLEMPDLEVLGADEPQTPPLPKFSHLLRRVRSVKLAFLRPETVHGGSALAQSLRHMPHLTRLEFGLDIYRAVPLRHGPAVFECLRLATCLRSLTVWPVAPRAEATRRAGNMAAAMCDSLCEELPNLLCLTSLRLAVTSDALWFVGNVLKRCGQLQGLQRLRLVVRDWHGDAPMPCGEKGGTLFWNVEALTGLRSLEIDTGGLVAVSGTFLRSLAQLTALRRLHLHAQMCAVRIAQLGWLTQEHLPSLLWLAVDYHRLTEELLLDLQARVPARVWFSSNPDSFELASCAITCSLDL